MKAVIMERLSKTYPNGKKAVDSVSVNLEPGEVFGFLGPNGAGKTTTVKLLNGMLTPTEGSCRIFGIDPSKEPEQAHALSGVVTEHAQMYDHLTGLDNLIFYGSIFGLNTLESEKRGKQLLEELDLTEAGDEKLATYSTGMRQRLSLARALMHKPKILFLDEPTSGLDPESAQKVHRMIRTLAKENGISVFLCTHQLRYAQEICTRYGLMEEGKLLSVGTLDELRSCVSKGITVTIRANGVSDNMRYRKIDDCTFEVDIREEKEIPGLIQRLVEAGGEIYHVSSKQPSLEDIYFTLTDHEKTSR